MDSVPPANLPLVIEALRTRVDRELARALGQLPASTEVVGGWAKIGGLLDALLRTGFTLLCDERGLPAEATFRRFAEREAWSIAKASAGQLRTVLALAGAGGASSDVRLQRLIAAASDPRGALARAIALRNAMMHGRGEVDLAAQREALSALRAWVATLDTA